jgi:HPt (histidine-containing phosphotransfer) domain-containing protein
VGTVTSLTPLADGNTGVGFDVKHGDNRLLMQDSIMVLRQDNGPYLEILNTNPLSIRAPEGATIVGASDQREADLLLAARGLPSYGGGLAAMAGAAAAISSAAAATSGAAAASVPPAAATANALQQQFQSLQNWYLANSAHNAAIATQELDRIEQSAAALERELINQGRSAEAQRLRDQIDQLARTLTTTPPPPPSSGSTLVTPPVH